MPFQAVALVRTDRTRFEGLPGLLRVARVLAAARADPTPQLEHRVVLLDALCFLVELGEVRGEVGAPVLVKLLLACGDRDEGVSARGLLLLVRFPDGHLMMVVVHLLLLLLMLLLMLLMLLMLLLLGHEVVPRL